MKAKMEEKEASERGTECRPSPSARGASSDLHEQTDSLSGFGFASQNRAHLKETNL